MVKARRNLTDLVFERLTVIRQTDDHVGSNGRHRSKWLCKCICGATIEVLGFSLESKNTRSCGCLQDEVQSLRLTTHGKSQTKLYEVWNSTIQRCYSEKATGYENYGGRGIAVCKEWKDSIEPFIEWATANGYKKGLTIDREENDRNYEPSNCRFVSRSVNGSNRRRSSNNTSKLTGVFFHKNKWNSSIRFNNKTVHLGCFLSKRKALQERNEYITVNKLPHPIQVYVS